MLSLNTGLKTKVVNFFYNTSNNILDLGPKNQAIFPQEPRSFLFLFLRRQWLYRNLQKVKANAKEVGYSIFPHPNVVAFWNSLTEYNRANIGNLSIQGAIPNSATEYLEREAILQLINLLQADATKTEGYFTSGGTEANIYSAWLGRKYLQTKGIELEKIRLCTTSLTHFSVSKAADVVGVSEVKVPLDKGSYAMDQDSFEKKIKVLYKQGTRGFMICFTVGYALTGTSDPYKILLKFTDEFKNKHPDATFFCWIDAALYGLIKPFVSEWKPFEHPSIFTVLVDFHKFPAVPAPAGVVLFQSHLRTLIERENQYIESNDSTLLSSRSGVAPATSWFIIQKLGKAGFRKKIAKNMKAKYEFMAKHQHKHIQFIDAQDGLLIGIRLLKGNPKHYFQGYYDIHFKKISLLFTTGEEAQTFSIAPFINQW